MVFTSHIFLFYFLPLVLLIYYAVPTSSRNVTLTLASYVFYGWWKPWFVLLMLTSTVVDYVAGRVISTSENQGSRRLALVASIIVNLGLLAFFKYYMFTMENLNALSQAVGGPAFQVLKVTLPIGISFYTFQTLSYTIDVYRRTAAPVKRFGDFACFVSLCPQLIAGPIVRYNTIANQLADRPHNISVFGSGAAIFILGFAKKILIANPLGLIADSAFAAESPWMLDAWLGVTAYAFQIYFDFSGYSDMAIGLGRMFGFEFPRNFNAPYQATSITDFWRRWHISLSTFLRDYLYIPLGGSRLGAIRTYVNLALVMLLGGLWHGAKWNFVAWGAFHGSLLALERYFAGRGFSLSLPTFLRIVATFVLVLISWVLFRAETFAAAGQFFASMLGFGGQGELSALVAAELYQPRLMCTLALAVFLSAQPVQGLDWVKQLSLPRVIALIGLLLLAIAEMFGQAFNPFLYFRF